MPKPSSINPDLESLLKQLLRDAKQNIEMPLDEKLSIIDRSMKLEALKMKALDDTFGKDYDLGDTTDE